MKNARRALCCAPRDPSPGWTATSRSSCLEDFAPGLPNPIVVVGDLERRFTYQQILQFEPGSARLRTRTETLDAMAELFQRPRLRVVFLHGTTAAGEAATQEQRDALARRRVRAVVDELTRRGVPPGRLVEQDSQEFRLTRTDLSDRERNALFDAPSVLVYGVPPKPHTARSRAPEPCYPGVKATLSVPVDQLEPGSSSTLQLTTCLRGSCARAAVALDTLSSGDELIVRLEGQPRAGATLAWKADHVKLVVRTVAAESQLENGARYELRVNHNDRPLRRLQQTLEYPDSAACRVAEVSDDG